MPVLCGTGRGDAEFFLPTWCFRGQTTHVAGASLASGRHRNVDGARVRNGDCPAKPRTERVFDSESGLARVVACDASTRVRVTMLER